MLQDSTCSFGGSQKSTVWQKLTARIPRHCLMSSLYFRISDKHTCVRLGLMRTVNMTLILLIIMMTIKTQTVVLMAIRIRMKIVMVVEVICMEMLQMLLLIVGQTMSGRHRAHTLTLM